MSIRFPHFFVRICEDRHETNLASHASIAVRLQNSRFVIEGFCSVTETYASRDAT